MNCIACLGWGSLTWDPRDLLIEPEWFKDGPLIKVEFVRQSNDGRITLTLEPNSDYVPSLWAKMQTNKIDEAIESLRSREGISNKYQERDIGIWKEGEASPELIYRLSEWAGAKGITNLIWTNLSPKFNKIDKTPTVEEVIEYLTNLTGDTRNAAETYIRNAPIQINTAYRREIEYILGRKVMIT